MKLNWEISLYDLSGSSAQYGQRIYENFIVADFLAAK